MALAIGSLALIADSLDFVEDAALNLLIFAGIGWSLRNRARLGMALAGILLLPALATAYAAWEKISDMAPPAPLPLTLAGLGALGVNLVCAMMLARHREGGGSLTRAAYLSARNDAFANLAIIGAGLVTALTLSPWPDLVAAPASPCSTRIRPWTSSRPPVPNGARRIPSRENVPRRPAAPMPGIAKTMRF